MSLNHLTGAISDAKGKFVANSYTVKPVITTAAGATTLLGGQSGSIILMSTVGAGMQFTLPAVASSAGWEAFFVLDNATAGANCTIVSPTSSTLVGTLIVNAAKVAMTTNTTLTIVSGTATKGDHIRIVGSGNFFHVDGTGQAAGSITVA